MRDALQRLLQDAGRSLEPAGRAALKEQELAEGCVFPLFIGTTGPVMRDLRGGTPSGCLMTRTSNVKSILADVMNRTGFIGGLFP